jgi:hypothetical protein
MTDWTSIARDPDVKADIFSLWVHTVPNDEDWINISVVCKSAHSVVTVNGYILMMADLYNWYEQLVRMDKSVAGNARLSGIEPYLTLQFAMDKLGNIAAELDVLNECEETHHVKFSLDQSFLPAVISQLKALFDRSRKC